MAQKNKNTCVNKDNGIDYNKLSNAVKKAIIDAEKECETKDDKAPKALKKMSIFRLMFAKKSEIISSSGTNVFLQLCMTSIIYIVQAMLCFLVIRAIYATYMTWLSIVNIVLSIVVIVVSGLLIGLLRVVRIEIEKEQDRKYLLNLSASFASIFALFVAIIALFIRG